jgi:hypothetical protein
VPSSHPFKNDFFFEKPPKSTFYDKEIIIKKNNNKLTLYTSQKQGTYVFTGIEGQFIFIIFLNYLYIMKGLFSWFFFSKKKRKKGLNFKGVGRVTPRLDEHLCPFVPTVLCMQI